MDLEIAWPFLIPCLVALLVSVCLAIFSRQNRYIRILMVAVASITLPAFVPGHGEIKGILPNCALLAVPYTPPKAISVIYIQLYFGALTLAFYKLKFLK